ncbi:hypothetical protein LRP31_25715 [Mesorhizobium mediterraneum]|uniref:Uncharacterized protein n=1 Tax=Mesorhizobium mediterraneum TaxID=43617 RepID=A0AB36RH91_9HYPH|nr:hypothetical protein [Mesorhizobium mediterraneum]PAQ03682.1 hypothetical protein CIT25_03975 [Mesorhizobium mediterraneum]WIW52421.1 hypothetical protein LRP31_25715 [Mesorhizobium mediterraneum]
MSGDTSPSDLIAELRSGVPTEGTNRDGFDLYDIDSAETIMARAADHIAALEAALENATEQAKHYPTVAGENMRLREAGAQLANVAYNIDQRGVADRGSLQSLKAAQMVWDEALSAARLSSKGRIE